MDIVVNELIQSTENTENNIDRVLWVDNRSNLLILINIYLANALPIIRNMDEIKEHILSGKMEKVTTDPYLFVDPGDKIREKNNKMRDYAWNMIEKAVSSEPEIYYSENRGRLLKQIVDEYKCSYRTVYKYIRRYWQRGKNKNALLPDFRKCGGKGKAKKLSDKKIGRPPKLYTVDDSRINIDKTIEIFFEWAATKYYYSPKKYSRKASYLKMLNKFFSEKIVTENGIRKVIFKKQKPKLTQFNYYLDKKDRDLQNKISSRQSLNYFYLNKRPVLYTSDSPIIGPGTKYQIDATVGDIYLLSRLNRDCIIGRPVIYVVKDVFSRMIVGLYVGLEGPSWIGAMMALANTGSDKVKFCSDFDIHISDADWPCKYLPKIITGDRGELISYQSDTLINSFHITVENTPPYRADFKGIIERTFRTINEQVKPQMPGSILPDFRQRGGNDYRLDAQLDIDQFTEIMIYCVLHYNNKPIDNFRRDEIMISDYVEPIPLKLWEWGLSNRSGDLQTICEKDLKVGLMPKYQGMVTSRGLRYKGNYYKNDDFNNWFITARDKGDYPIEISFDPRNMDNVYIRSEDGKNYDEFYMIEGRGYKNTTLEELEYLLITQNNYNKKIEESKFQSEAGLQSHIDDVNQKAIKQNNQKKGLKISKSEKIANIRQNRAFEKYKRRKSESFIQNKINNSNPLKEIKENNNEDNIIDMEYIIKQQEEVLNKKNGI